MQGITATVQPDGNLLITADNDARATLAMEMRGLWFNYWLAWSDALESYSCNGSYTHFDAGAGNPFVGLTSAPCIAESMDYADDGLQTIQGRFWYFADYQLTDDLAQLRDTGRVIYTLAPTE